MRKTTRNLNSECPASAAAAERLADYKGEKDTLWVLGFDNSSLIPHLCLIGKVSVTTPDTEFHSYLPTGEMPEVHEGGSVPGSSGSSSKDSKVITTTREHWILYSLLDLVVIG